MNEIVAHPKDRLREWSKIADETKERDTLEEAYASERAGAVVEELEEVLAILTSSPRREPDQVFVICIDNVPAVAITRNYGDPAPQPTDVLDAFSKEYAFERNRLTWSTATIISWPKIPGFNEPV